MRMVTSKSITVENAVKFRKTAINYATKTKKKNKLENFYRQRYNEARQKPTVLNVSCVSSRMKACYFWTSCLFV